MSRKPRPTNSKSPMLRFLALCVAYWGVALLVLSRFPGVERFGIAITVTTVEWVGVLTIADDEEVPGQTDTLNWNSEAATDLNRAHTQRYRNADTAFKDSVQIRVTRVAVVGPIAAESIGAEQCPKNRFERRRTLAGQVIHVNQHLVDIGGCIEGRADQCRQ